MDGAHYTEVYCSWASPPGEAPIIIQLRRSRVEVSWWILHTINLKWILPDRRGRCCSSLASPPGEAAFIHVHFDDAAVAAGGGNDDNAAGAGAGGGFYYYYYNSLLVGYLSFC